MPSAMVVSIVHKSCTASFVVFRQLTRCGVVSVAAQPFFHLSTIACSRCVYWNVQVGPLSPSPRLYAPLSACAPAARPPLSTMVLRDVDAVKGLVDSSVVDSAVKAVSLASERARKLRTVSRKWVGKTGPSVSPAWVGSGSPMGWWFGLAPATLEFWVRFPTERNQGKQAHPVLKCRVLLRVPGQTSPHQPRLVVSHTTCPPLSPSPHANSFVIGPAVINTNLQRCDAQDTLMARQFQHHATPSLFVGGQGVGRCRRHRTEEWPE